MGRTVQVGQEEQGIVPVFRTTVTAYLPDEIPMWIWIFLAAVAGVAILKRE